MKIKRVMISFLFSLFIPLTTIFALTDKVYIGGENVGIEVKTNGVLVVGLYEVNNELIASSSNINSGDYIVEVNGNKIVNIDDFSKEINNDLDKDRYDPRCNGQLAAAEVFDFDSSILLWSEFMASSSETDTLQPVYQVEIAPRY